MKPKNVETVRGQKLMEFCLGSQLQFVLPVTWSYGKKYGVTLEQIASWWSDRPSKLAGLHSKVPHYNKPQLQYSLFIAPYKYS